MSYCYGLLLSCVFGHNIGDEDKVMTVHGKISYFNSNQESWSSYMERLGYYFTANDVRDDDKKKAILLTVCGPAAFELLKSLLQPSTTNDKTYPEIIKVLSDHFSPTPSVIMQRYKFNTRTRKDSESVATYVAELKHLGEHCQFGDKLNEMVRDRLVCGVNDIRIQNRLLQESSSLTYEKAFQIAQSIELAAKDAAALHRQVPVPALPIQQLNARGKRFTFTCYRCGGNHLANSCSFQKVECRACGKIGHIAKVCKSRQSSRQPIGGTPKSSKKPSVHALTSKPTLTSTPVSSVPPKGLDSNYTLFTLTGKAKPLVIAVNVNGSDIPMELDTGALLSVISEQTFHSIASTTDKLQSTDITLTTYTGHSLSILGTFDVQVCYQSQVHTLPLVVVQGQGPSLFGRNWLEEIKLDWNSIHTLQNVSVSPLLDKYAPLFADKLGLLQGASAKLYVDPQATPKFFRARPVPYRLKEKVEIELDRLQKLGITSPVQHAEWATPIVPIMKKDGNIRLCGDYKVTVNRSLTPDNYPLPRVEDIFAALQNGKLFTKLDLSQAYQQLPLDEDSKKFTTINTHKGLFQYERLPFGISTAPSIFQRLMENLLRDLPNVCVYIDDILVSGKNDADHLHNLEQVLARLTSAGITLKRSKCIFATTSLEYLGHIIDSNGLHPSPTKVQAIQEAPAPTNLTELRAFLGLANYYHKFLPNLSDVLAPLHSLLCKGTKWTWTDPQQTAFDEVKQLLQSSSLLVHYDSEKPLLIL